MIEDYIKEIFDVSIPDSFNIENELERIIDFAFLYGYKIERLKSDVEFFSCCCRSCDYYNFIYKECSKDKCEKKSPLLTD